jgi:hypothetical protein
LPPPVHRIITRCTIFDFDILEISDVAGQGAAISKPNCMFAGRVRAAGDDHAGLGHPSAQRNTLLPILP